MKWASNQRAVIPQSAHNCERGYLDKGSYNTRILINVNTKKIQPGMKGGPRVLHNYVRSIFASMPAH